MDTSDTVYYDRIIITHMWITFDCNEYDYERGSCYQQREDHEGLMNLKTATSDDITTERSLCIAHI